jgi:virulence factor Mce-like protein
VGAVVLVAWWVINPFGARSYPLRAVFAAALQVVPGERVEIGGRQVGSISSASLLDGQAVVGMNIDASSWPLHAGTTAELRFGSPLGYALRYIQLVPGPARAPLLPAGGIIAEDDTQTPVELDQIAEIFDPKTRAALGGLLDNAGATLKGEGSQLADVLGTGGPGAEQVAGLTSDLAQNPGALGQLLSSAGALAGTLHAHSSQLYALVKDAAATVQVLDEQADAVRASLKLAPGALHSAQRTLANLSRTLPTLETLVRDIAPGASGLRSIAAPLVSLLTRLDQVAPELRKTLRAGVAAAPSTIGFLSQGIASLPALTRALGSLGPVVGCLRPYAPELAGALAVSDSSYAPYDSAGHYLRTLLVNSEIPEGEAETMTPAQIVKQYSAMHYAFPRPPGLNVSQPWFQPQCGVTKAALDAADNAESR